MSTATYQPREKEERVAMAIGLSTIERVKSKARIVFERARPRESVSKNNGVFNPYLYARSFRSSFPLFSFRILVRTLRPWWKRDLVWFCCSYLLYRLCFSSLKGALWKSAGVVSSIFRCFVNNEFLLLFPPVFFSFFLSAVLFMLLLWRGFISEGETRISSKPVSLIEERLSCKLINRCIRDHYVAMRHNLQACTGPR